MNRRLFINNVFGQAVGLSLINSTLGCDKSSHSQVETVLVPAATNSNGTQISSHQLPSNLCKIEIVGDQRIITTNSIPKHRFGSFPNMDCPFPIKALNKTYTVPLNPEFADHLTPLNGWLQGVSVEGVPFDPTGPFWELSESNQWEFEVMSGIARPYLGLDSSSAHVQPNGEYHYHGLPYDLLSTLETKQAGSQMILLGFAADGFPIYAPFAPADPLNLDSSIITVHSSYNLKKGSRPQEGPLGNYDGTYVQDYEYIESLNELDECNGRFGVTPEFPDGIYHYFITLDFPFVPRFYKGTPDPSFAHNLPGPDAVPPTLKSYGRPKT